MNVWEIVKKVHCYIQGLDENADVSDYQKGKGGETGGGGPEASLWSIVDIAAEAENDQQETCSGSWGSWGDDQTSSPTHNKDLELSKKSAR